MNVTGAAWINRFHRLKYNFFIQIITIKTVKLYTMVIQILILLVSCLACLAFFKSGYAKGMSDRAEEYAKLLSEIEAKIDSVYEGAEKWKQEYDDCRKKLKAVLYYRNAMDIGRAKEDAAIFLEKYQHFTD